MVTTSSVADNSSSNMAHLTDMFAYSFRRACYSTILQLTYSSLNPRQCYELLTSATLHLMAACRLKHYCRSVHYMPFIVAVFLFNFFSFNFYIVYYVDAFQDIYPRKTNTNGNITPYRSAYKLMHSPQSSSPYFDKFSERNGKIKSATKSIHNKNKHNLIYPLHVTSSSANTSSSLLLSLPFLSVKPSPVSTLSKRTNSFAQQNQIDSDNNKLVTPQGALFNTLSSEYTHRQRPPAQQHRISTFKASRKKREPEQTIKVNVDASRTKAHLSRYIPNRKSEKTASHTRNNKNEFSNLFTSSLFNDSFNLAIAPEPQYSSVLYSDSHYLPFDSDDVSSSRDDFFAINKKVENYDLFDYLSDETYESIEQLEFPNKKVSPNDSLLFDTLYKPKNLSPFTIDSNYPVYNFYTSSDSNEVKPLLYSTIQPYSRQPRYVAHRGSLNITWPVKKVAEVQGNITLGGLMMVHEREDKQICGPIMPQGGIQALEAMLHTIDYVNSRDDILSGITLGAYILDDCDKDTYGLEQSINFIKGSITNIDEGYRCSDGSTRAHKKIWGVLGAASSATSIQVANLLRLFRIPQVSFFSTSSELSNKQRFEYFLRTVPSDKSQALAIVEIVKRLNWSYVSIIYEESIYGIRAFNDLEELLDQNDICIAMKERLTKDSGVAADSSYDNIIKKLTSKPNAKGVIVFGSDQEVALLMNAVKRNNATGQFYWIGSDGWSARSSVSTNNEFQVEGTISVQPMANPVPGFDEYFLNLTPKNNKRNPWFIEYWEQYFNCKWPDSEYTPYNQHFNKNCTGNEKVTNDNGYEVEGQLQFVSDAVLAFAYAIKHMQKELCPKTVGVCKQMLSADGSQLLQHLQTVKFKGIDGHEVYFADNGDGPARYRIIHYKQIGENDFNWIQVGEYVDGNLNLDLNKVQFRLLDPEMPISVCSQPCEKGQAKTFLEGEKCCFHCLNCTKYQVLVSETQCIDCPSGFLPNVEQIECIPIPEEYMRPDSLWSIGAILFSWIGIFVTIFVIVIFIKYNDTPVVRASGRELCYMLLVGILLCYGMTFILVQKPTTFICGAQKAGIGLCFSVVYSAILTKTNRISRIFKAGKKSARRPNFISPKSQLLICGCFVIIQCFIIIVWLAFSPPKVIHYHPTREDNKLICQASINAGYFVAFLYPIFLIVVCTVYAVLTRNIPEAFNESKFIGFTMYTTCIIWLAFVPIYFTSSQSNHIALNITTLSVSISLSSTVTLLCLFTPKLYIILLHPEKNVRQSMMPQHHKSTIKPIAPTKSQESLGQNAVIKVTACIPVNSTRVDSATQSDEYEMSEVMVITSNNKATFESLGIRSINNNGSNHDNALQAPASPPPVASSPVMPTGSSNHIIANGRKSSLTNRSGNPIKCRCMQSNAINDVPELDDSSDQKSSTAAANDNDAGEVIAGGPSAHANPEPVKRCESKATQTVVSTVNGINGGIIATRSSIDLLVSPYISELEQPLD